MATFDERGREILDETPLTLAVKFDRPPTIAEQVSRLVRVHLNRIAEQQGAESFEEADDFDVGEDYDPRSPHELERDQELEPPFTRERLEAEFVEFLRSRQARAQPQAGGGVNGDPPASAGGVPGGDPPRGGGKP